MDQAPELQGPARKDALGLPFAPLPSVLAEEAGAFPEEGGLQAGIIQHWGALPLNWWLSPERPGLVAADLDNNRVNTVIQPTLALSSHCVAALPHFLAWPYLLFS